MEWISNNLRDKLNRNYTTTKSRLEIITIEIEEFLKKDWMDFNDIELLEPYEQHEEELLLFERITREISTDIDIDVIERPDDRRWQASIYLMWSKLKWYTIILDNEVESNELKTAEQFAEYIYELEKEVETLTLTIKK